MNPASCIKFFLTLVILLGVPYLIFNNGKILDKEPLAFTIFCALMLSGYVPALKAYWNEWFRE